MQTTNWLSSMPVSCWILLAAVGLAGAAPQDLEDLYYEMTYDSRSTVDFEDPARADSEEATHNRYRYELKRGEKGIRAFLLGMSVHPTLKGRPTGGAMLLTTERYLDNAMEEYRAKAPPEIVKIFADSFDSPAATFDRERKGFLPAGSLPSDAIGGHLKVFHAPFVAKEATWSASARVPLVMADGIEGELTYSRGEERGDRVIVRVSGDLTRPTSAFAQEESSAGARTVELTVTEYSNVAFQVLRGAPGGKRAALGESNQKNGSWSENGTRAMTVCAFLFGASRPVVDVVPDLPQEGELLECKIMAPGEDHLGRVISKYEYVWKRFEGKD